jgi:hypothetical protein
MSGDFLFENTLTPRIQDSLGKLLIYIGYFLFALAILYTALQNKIVRNFVNTNMRVMNSVLGNKNS